VRGPFVVHLGDNFFEEGASRFAREFVEGGYDAFIVLTRVRDPTRFGYVLVREGRVWKLVEKPRQPPPGGYTLTGFYAFRDPGLVERAFKDLKPSQRGEYEVTDLIQWFVDRGYRVGYTVTNGWWKDMGTPSDLLDLVYLLLDRIETRIEGEVSGEVSGRVVVEKGAVVEGRVYGPVYIGRGALVGKSAAVEHYVSVEQDAKIESGSVVRSLVLEGAVVDVNKLRIVDSIVGRQSRVKSSREIYGEMRLAVSDYSRVEL
jgi:glucose-1-phosphate thymidylyltransferase